MSTAQWDLLLKFLVIGERGVGKSALIRQYVDREFDGQYVTTIGVDFAVKTVQHVATGKVIKQQIWDTAGQERFRTITQSYYRGANGVLLLYDITDLESFNCLSSCLLYTSPSPRDS